MFSPDVPRQYVSLAEFEALCRDMPAPDADLRAHRYRAGAPMRWWARVGEPSHLLLAFFGEIVEMHGRKYERIHLRRVVVRVPAARAVRLVIAVCAHPEPPITATYHLAPGVTPRPGDYVYVDVLGLLNVATTGEPNAFLFIPAPEDQP